MGLFTRKENEVPETTNRQVEGAEVWVVSWTSLSGSYPNSPTLVSDTRRAKAFIREKDAQDFKKALEDAMSLLQCGFAINIRVEKQV